MSWTSFWDKCKWYFLGGTVIVLVIVFFVFQIRDKDLYREVFELMYDQKESRIQKRRQSFQRKTDQTQHEIDQVEKQIEDVQNRREVLDERAESATPIDIAKEFQTMGY